MFSFESDPERRIDFERSTGGINREVLSLYTIRCVRTEVHNSALE